MARICEAISIGEWQSAQIFIYPTIHYQLAQAVHSKAGNTFNLFTILTFIINLIYIIKSVKYQHFLNIDFIYFLYIFL